MTYKITEPEIGLQPITTISTTQNHPLGKIVRAKDPTLGSGEFIYLLGVVNTVAGLVVRYNATTFQTTLVTNTAVQDTPIAVAMAANVAASYGWYQICGLATILKTNVQFNPTVAMYLSATAGRVKAVASAGLQLTNTRSANLATVTTTTSTIVALINRPSLQSQIT
jgi:hypothetical protein